ncbi:hypothetical protein KCU67_g1848, partial [Aureobasidium melanogenum]
MVREVTEDDTGIRVLWEPRQVEAEGSGQIIDIVAIHGIGAHPDDTWCKLRKAGLDVTRPENYVNWLNDPNMLPSRIPNARIMRYGYQSAWHGAEVTEQGTSLVAPRVIKTKTSDVAQRFLQALVRERKLPERRQKRPLIIVAHCFGGLVVLKAILEARDNPEKWPHIFQSVTGLIFLGTPFRGAEGISQSEMLQAALSKYDQGQVQPEVLKILDPGNELLQNFVDKFGEIRSKPNKAHVACFYETKPCDIGRIIGQAGKNAFMVSESSGCLDVSDNTEKWSLERDHFGMNKFRNPNEEDFQIVCEVLEKMVDAAPDLLLARSREDEERVINGVKALVDATTDPPKEQSEKLANSIQRSMSEVIQLAFRRAEISEAVTGDIWRVPRIPRHDRSDIERISAMIRINSSVRVNERTQYRISKNSIGPLIRETYQDSSSIAHGTFEIRTISRKTANGRKVSLESVITFTANRTQYREFLLSMHLMQLYGSQSATIMPATIIMHEKISYNHPIFQAIIQGNYNTFTKLIHDRSARIWDRDPEGRSLLIYAITFGQVDMVRYLVQHGIDVNDRGKPVDGKIVPRKFSFHIGYAARSDMYRILDDARDTWAKLRLLWSRGAMRDFKGNMRSHIFKCTLRRFDVMHRYSDLAQTLDSLLASKVKDSTKHHEQVDLDDQVQLVTKDFDDTEYDLSHLLQDVAERSSDTRGQDLIYCAVRRALLRDNWYRDWMARHPQKPSTYDKGYTPFHHLSWFRQKSPILPSRAACPFGSDEQVSLRRDERDWYKRFKMGEWPEMSSQEESIIAHRALVKRRRYENGQAWTETLAWSPQGEIHVQWSCSDTSSERYDEQLSDWSSDDSVQYSDAADLNSDEVSSPPDRWDCQEVPPDDSSRYSDAAGLDPGEISSLPDGCDRGDLQNVITRKTLSWLQVIMINISHPLPDPTSYNKCMTDLATIMLRPWPLSVACL